LYLARVCKGLGYAITTGLVIWLQVWAGILDMANHSRSELEDRHVVRRSGSRLQMAPAKVHRPMPFKSSTRAWRVTSYLGQRISTMQGNFVCIIPHDSLNCWASDPSLASHSMSLTTHLN
jgi:hypothetical protein